MKLGTARNTPSQLAAQQSTWLSNTQPLFLTGALFSVVALFALSNTRVLALFSPVTFQSPLSLLLLLLATSAALVTHEFGHLLAAVLCRFELMNISLGVFRFTRTHTGWRFHARRQKVFTGSVSALPRANHLWRERMLTVVAAGPAATLLSLLVASCLLVLLPVKGNLASFFLLAFFQVSFLIFTLGLIPNASGSQAQNDARMFLSLWRDGEEANAIFLYHLVLQHQRQGLEPRDFPLWLIELMSGYQGRKDFMTLYAGMIASYAFDRGDYLAGDRWDRRALLLSQNANPATRHACLANSACFDLVFRKNVHAAREKLAQIPVQAISSPSLQHRVAAARELALGRIAKTLAEVAAARAFLPTGLQDRGFDSFLLKRIHASALSVR